MATKFEKYEAVRQSGVTNMFALDTVMQLSGLTKAEVLDVMTNYAEYKAQAAEADADDDQLYCELCGRAMADTDKPYEVFDGDLATIACADCFYKRNKAEADNLTNDVGRTCERCGVETCDANPVMPVEAGRYDIWGDPQPSEVTYLCAACIIAQQVDDDEIPY